jgi:hypothetical protein
MVERRPARGRGSTRYELVVCGVLDARFASAFPEMAIHVDGGRTHLVGDVVDQAQLHGLLGRFQLLGIELVSVNPLSEGQEEADLPKP